MTAAPLLASRTLRGAATRRVAASSVAPVASGYARLPDVLATLAFRGRRARSARRVTADGPSQVQADEPRPALPHRLGLRGDHEVEPEKSLLEPLKKTGGRNSYGRITTRHQGGGHKRRYRVIDFKRIKDGVPAKVAAIEYDPNRSARIALLHYADGAKAYILAPRGSRSGRRSSRARVPTSSRATRSRSSTSRPARSSTTSS